MADLIGHILRNRYRVDSLLGRGGMGDVYKVWDSQRGVFLAIKVLHADLAEDRVFLRRFAREAETLSALQHPHIVRFYGLEQEGRVTFMLMDYVEGTTLRGEIFDAHKPFTVEQVLRILKPVCSALHYAHQMGRVHCDIKPANIMVRSNGEVLIADFGIARMMENSTTTTMAGAGTPAYMAPEQVLGKNPSPQTDIYALGIVLYEMLTGGERPFTGEQASIEGSTSEKVRWEQITLNPPSPRTYNPNISLQLEAVVMKCLEKKPEDRYADVFSLLNSISLEPKDDLIESVAIRGSQPVNPPSVKKYEKNKSDIKQNSIKLRKKSASLLGLLIGAVLVIVVGLSLKFNSLTPSVPLIPILTTTITSNTKPPTNTSTPEPTFTPTFTPTALGGGSGRIAFSSKRDGNSGIYVMNADGSNPVNLSNNNRGDDSPVWSPDGKRIAFESESYPNEQIYVMNADGSNPVNLSNNNSADRNPVWSPDGAKIAFVSRRDGDTEIYVMNADGTSSVKFTNTYGYDVEPAWSPDGTKIAFTLSLSDRVIYVMNTDGSNLVRLTKSGWTNSNPVWSPDGAKIAFSSKRDGNYEIYIMNAADGSTQVNLTNNIGNDSDPIWSPDGAKIAFHSTRDGNDEIYLMNADGSNHVNLTNNSGHDFGPVWSPDGTRIAFSSERDGNYEVYIMNADGSHQSNLTNNSGDDFGPVWEP